MGLKHWSRNKYIDRGRNQKIYSQDEDKTSRDFQLHVDDLKVQKVWHSEKIYPLLRTIIQLNDRINYTS